MYMSILNFFLHYASKRVKNGKEHLSLCLYGCVSGVLRGQGVSLRPCVMISVSLIPPVVLAGCMTVDTSLCETYTFVGAANI